MIQELARAAALSLLLAPIAAPVLAGPAETAYLQRLVGTWNGEGQVRGAESGTVTCRITIRPNGEDRLNLQGRCAYSGGSMSQTISGRITYDDARGVYISSTGGQSVAGKKSGNNLVFTSTQRNIRGSATSTMTLSPSALKVQFEATETRNGNKSRGTISLTKS